MTTTDEFFTAWNNKGCDYDGYYGFQCMDLANQFNRDVNHAPFLVGPNAKDVWSTYPKDTYDAIPNSPDNAPQKGDIVIWGTGVGQYGHIAICDTADANSFTSFDQNWPLNSLCHFQPHNYNNVLGWLRLKPQMSTPLTQTASESDDEDRALKILKDHFASSTTKDGQPFGNLEGYANTLTQDAYQAWKNPPQFVPAFTTTSTSMSPAIITQPIAQSLGPTPIVYYSFNQLLTELIKRVVGK